LVIGRIYQQGYRENFEQQKQQQEVIPDKKNQDIAHFGYGIGLLIGCWLSSWGFRVPGARFRVPSSGCRVPC